MDDIKAKQQIVEKIKASATILVTVSNDPSVDALSAALGLTLLLDKLEKHPTAIFSGDVPPAISFLEPEKTFDTTTDSLRDFIIALDKEKADHLRYKVEGDNVKIFITPYKTTITSDDLEFSQGDYNVELVIALGVDVQEHLDDALEAHGQILHDADIITVTAGEQVSNLGGIDWHDDQASSLSEMVAGLAEALKTDKKKSLLDAPIATAFLTGIVAETDRFSNTHTTSRVMTTAAQLMAAGADQQLIAMKLQEAQEIETPAEEPAQDLPEEKEETPEEEPAPEQRNTLSIKHDESHESKPKKEKASEPVVASETPDNESEQEPEEEPEEPEAPVESLDEVAIKPEETLEDMDKRVKAAEQAEALAAADAALAAGEDNHAANASVAEAANAYVPTAEVPVTNSTDELPAPATPFVPTIPEPVNAPQPYEPTLGDSVSTPLSAPMDPQVQPAQSGEETDEPSFGGTLNATTEQAADDARREEESDQNKTILSHSYLDSTQDEQPGTQTGDAPEQEPSHSNEPNAYGDNNQQSGAPVAGAYAPAGGVQPMSHELVIQPPVEPLQSMQPAPVDLGLPMPPALPDFSNAQPATGTPYAFEPTPVTQPEILGDILAPEPNAPQGPFGQPQQSTSYAPPAPQPQFPQPSPNDPGQFKIPGQQ